MGGITSVLQGGKFGHGFVAAGLGAAAGSIPGLEGAGFQAGFNRVLVSAVVGGTISEITGGKFANGAAYGAFSSILVASAKAATEESHPYINIDNSEEVISSKFVSGDRIPDAVKAKVLNVKPELEKALNAATLEHADESVINEIGGQYGIDPGLIKAYVKKTVIYVPAGQGVRFGTLTHEVTHIHQYLTVPNFESAYNKAFQSGIKSRMTPFEAYTFNIYEMQARRFTREVLRENGY